MRSRTIIRAALGTTATAIIGGLLASFPAAAAETTVAALARETHLHGISVDPSDSTRVYLATHHGLYLAASDGRATQISVTRDDFMGFTPHPSDPAMLYASGHPARGGNLGFIASSDGGKSWVKLGDGFGGPVDFHQMDVSKADPKVIYGVYGDLQKSTDGGRGWQRVGPAPDGLISLATSSRSAERLYAATQGGLLASADGGRSWNAAHPVRQPVTAVHVTQGGTVYAFIVGVGLVRAAEPDLNWQTVGGNVGNRYLLHIAVEPRGERTLYAAMVDAEKRTTTIVSSRDGGATWAALGGDGG
ncbi:exo-alpha-sialidase [Chelatococcus sp. SYSU_G07232]|uniref:Exo-alpha-sialidase n=1 Tax=Chelatococcus albus TaxID=3047466 RepID=A0ABT7AH22_9HYPH|nr:exo-alpha-sialidase [Chelatococcus sp. SYSU_G07232]MDJ1158682.1 exo-alpha-sialidase [Chelatococcus sp. SYSU_G07232]